MVAVHLLYDLTELYGLVTWKIPGPVQTLTDWGGKSFLILSGLCATLGHHPVRRGITVLGGGILISTATFLLWKAGFSDHGILIYFGVLHCLGCCMLLWPMFQGCSRPVLLSWGILLLVLGRLVLVLPKPDTLLLIPVGITPNNFVSADYYPLLPGLGYFLIGGWLGRVLYREKKSLFPGCNSRAASILCWVGTHSLPIYLLHQPVLTGLITCVLFLD